MPEKERGRSSIVQRGKGTAKQHMTRRVEKHSNRGKKGKGHQENIQNLKRNMVRHWNRKSRYT